MGTVYKRQGSRYYWGEYTPHPGAKPIRRSTKETRRALAYERVLAWEQEARDFPFLEPGSSRLTFSHFARLPNPHDATDQGGDFWQWARGNLAENTRTRYRDILRTQLLPAFGRFTLAAIHPRAIEKWKLQRLTQVSPSSVRKELFVLSKIFKLAIRYGMLSWNPVQSIEKPKAEPKPLSILTKEQIRAFFTTAFQFFPQSALPLLTMYLTGLRVSALQHLTPDDVDLETNRLWVRCKTGWHPKNRQARAIPLVDPLRFYLAQHLATHHDDEWLFTRRDRKDLYCPRCQRRVHHLGRLFKTIDRIARLAGITQHLTHHLFRHQYASHSQDMGIPGHQIRSILGQTSSQVLQIYTHTEFNEMHQQLRKLGHNLLQNCEAIIPHSTGIRETFPHIFPHSQEEKPQQPDVTPRKTSVPR